MAHPQADGHAGPYGRSGLTESPTFVIAPVLLALLHLPVASPGTLPATPPVTLPAVLQDVETAKESESGHRYPITSRSLIREADANSKDVKSKTMDLLGLAIREKTIFAVNVYSYVLYVDHEYVTTELKGWKGKKAKAIGKDSALFTKLLTPGPTKEIRLRFCRNVDADDVVSAFEDSIEPRLLARRKSKPGSKADKLKDLTEFRGFFSLDKLKKGNELSFVWHPGGTLTTVVNGERKADIVSPDLCWALFDVYLGEKPISKGGKKKLVKRLPQILAG